MRPNVKTINASKLHAEAIDTSKLHAEAIDATTLVIGQRRNTPATPLVSMAQFAVLLAVFAICAVLVIVLAPRL